MKVEHHGVEIDLVFDDGFPIVHINTGDSYHADGRPTVEVNINGFTVHEMFEYEENEK